jgi:hypothetical protein
MPRIPVQKVQESFDRFHLKAETVFFGIGILQAGNEAASFSRFVLSQCPVAIF